MDVGQISIEQVREAIYLQKKQAAEERLREFVAQAWHVLEPVTPLVPGIHLDAICDHLQAVTLGVIQDLIINVPPGHAKSLITCVFWPAWAWIKHPHLRWIFGAGRGSLAIRDSVKCRTLIKSDWYQSRWADRFALSKVVDEKTRFENDKTGVRLTTSVGTGTGERANVVVVDDPLGIDDAESDAIRTAANDWWTGTMYNRVNDLRTGRHVIIQQRLHEEDTTAVSLRQGGYQHLVLPAEYEPERACVTSIWKDPRTKAGQLLWPDYMGPDQIAAMKTTLGSYRYAGQYQQRPAPAGGGIFQRHWWRYWQPKYLSLPPVEVKLPDGRIQKIAAMHLPDDFDELIQSWDMSFKDLQSSDFVAGGVWGSRGAYRFLLDLDCRRLDFPNTCKAVVSMTAKWPKTTAKLVESAANGPAVVSSLKDKVPGIIPWPVEGSKVARAQAVSPDVEAGQVFLPHPQLVPWVNEFIEEHASFPNAAHDDKVDQTSQALRRLKTKVLKTSGPPRRTNTSSGDRGWMA